MATPDFLDNILWGYIVLFGLRTTQLWRIINCLQSLSAEKVRGAQLEPWGHCPHKCDFSVPMMGSSLYVQLRERMGTDGFSGRWSEGLDGRTRGRRKAEEVQRRRNWKPPACGHVSELKRGPSRLVRLSEDCSSGWHCDHHQMRDSQNHPAELLLDSYPLETVWYN